MKKKKKKGLIIAAVAVVAVILVVVLIPRNSVPVMAGVSTDQLAKTTLRNTISATGSVVSQDSTNVYAKLNGSTIQTVNVEVGDRVNAGDVLALFDTEDIEDQIKQQRASMNDSSAKAQQSIKLSEKQYNQMMSDFQSDMDASLLSAQTAVNNAQDAVTNAQYAVDHFGEGISHADAKAAAAAASTTGSGGSVADTYNYAQDLNTYKAAQKDVETAKKELETAKQSGNAEQISLMEDKLETLQKELDRCKELYEQTQLQYPDIDHQYEQLKTALKQAQDAYDLALRQFEITWNGTLKTIDSAADSIDTSKLNASQAVSQLTLAKLEKQLEDAVVTAPVSGTVTAVNAKEGAAGSGLLFEIEDTDALKIATTVKEYDFPSIKLGLPVEIKSDGTGEAVMSGKISKIAPTAVKASDAAAKTTSSVEFAIEIDVDRPHDGLLIGMKARCSIILNEAKDVYGVPYDAVLTDTDGSSYIFTAEAGDKGQMVAKKVPVEMGMESDFYVEISGEGLSDGMTVITTPNGITEGMPVPVAQTPVV